MSATPICAAIRALRRPWLSRGRACLKERELTLSDSQSKIYLVPFSSLLPFLSCLTITGDQQQIRMDLGNGRRWRHQEVEEQLLQPMTMRTLTCTTERSWLYTWRRIAIKSKESGRSYHQPLCRVPVDLPCEARVSKPTGNECRTALSIRHATRKLTLCGLGHR